MRSTYVDAIIIQIQIVDLYYSTFPIGGSFNQEINKLKYILGKRQPGEMKDEKSNDTIA